MKDWEIFCERQHITQLLAEMFRCHATLAKRWPQHCTLEQILTLVLFLCWSDSISDGLISHFSSWSKTWQLLNIWGRLRHTGQTRSQCSFMLLARRSSSVCQTAHSNVNILNLEIFYILFYINYFTTIIFFFAQETSAAFYKSCG